MRTIIVSTDVFAALWSRRQPDEDGENAVLERLLGLPRGPALPLQAGAFIRTARGNGPALSRGADEKGGIYNRMFDVHFAPGFEIFRDYKGRHYSAMVREGRWIMDGQSFPSLFALSIAIIDSRENPWMHWKYRDEKGRVQRISALRKVPPEMEEAAPEEAAPRATAVKKPARGRSRKS